MNLKVQKVDPFQLVNKCFTIAVVLPDSFPDISRRISNLPLKVDVYFDDEPYQSDTLDRNFHPNLVDVISNTNIDRTRRGLVTLRLKEPSSVNNNRKYIIKFTALSLEGERSSICGYSVPITAVRHKLKISEEFEGHGSYVWMKDVGGKDKSIDLQVGLIDANDTYVLNRRVPLRVALLYASGIPVPQQDILQLSPDSQLLISQSGFTRIKCRINEVSSRHQGQLFQILISPDSDHPSPLGDISPAYSVPVEVKSKINFSHKRKLQALGESASGDAGRSNAIHLGSGLKDGAKDAIDTAGRHVAKHDTYQGRSFDTYSSSNHSLTNASLHPGQMGRSNSGNSLGAMGPIIQQPLAHAPSSSILPLSSVLSNSGRSEAHTHSTSSSNHVSNLSVSSIGSHPNLNTMNLVDAEGSLISQRRSSDALNEMYHRAMHYSSDSSASTTPAHAHRTHSAPLLDPSPPIETALWGRSSVQAAEALKELTRWVELVYSSLREMQWTPLGQLPGAINPETGLPIAQEERLLYNMKNPNKLIESLALGYQERVLAHLTTLDSFITLRALTPKNLLPPPQAMHQLPLSARAADSYPSNGTHRAAVAPSAHAAANVSNNHHSLPYNTSSTIAAADVEQLLQLRGADALLSTTNNINNTDPMTTNTHHISSSPVGGFWETFQSQTCPSPRAVASASSQNAPSRVAPVVTAATTAPANTRCPPNLLETGCNSDHGSADYEQRYELSDLRVVYTDKTVCALVGPEKRELLLGFATFGSVDGSLRFIGFYALQEDGALGFQSHNELLSRLRSTTTASTNPSNANSTTSNGVTNHNSAASTTAGQNGTATTATDPLQQLLRQISAAELHNAMSLRRDSKTAAFDPSPLLPLWTNRARDTTARVVILVE